MRNNPPASLRNNNTAERLPTLVLRLPSPSPVPDDIILMDERNYNPGRWRAGGKAAKNRVAEETKRLTDNTHLRLIKALTTSNGNESLSLLENKNIGFVSIVALCMAIKRWS